MTMTQEERRKFLKDQLDRIYEAYPGDEVIFVILMHEPTGDGLSMNDLMTNMRPDDTIDFLRTTADSLENHLIKSQ
jgi:hypothetical protein